MYIEYRPPNRASTPESWAANFAGSKRLSKWHEMRLASSHEMNLIRRYVPRGARMLDIGCGFGEWVTLLRHRGYDAEGLDYSPVLIERLQREYPETAWRHGDVRNLDRTLGPYDAVISWGVIEHDPAGPGKALREIAGILRDGGIVIVSVPRDTALVRAVSSEQFPKTDDGEFFQFFMTAEELAGHLSAAGLQVLDTGTTRLPSLELLVRARPSRIYGLAAFLFSMFARWTRRYDGIIYCVARKQVIA